MENAVHAMIMAFSVIILVIALSISMYIFGQIGSTSQVLLYAADKTNYYDNISVSNDAENQITRYVDVDTIIPTLYRYYKENFCVKICDATDGMNANLVQIFDVNLEGKVRTAASATVKTREQIALNNLYNKQSENLYLFEAPWIGNTEAIKTRVDYYISGKAGYINNSYVDYTTNNLKKYMDKKEGTNENKYKFKETFAQYIFSGDTFTTDEGETFINGSKGNDKIVITYTIEKND